MVILLNVERLTFNASDFYPRMCASIFLVDPDPHTREAFDDDRVFERTRVPARQSRGLHESQRLGAGFLARAGDQHVTFNLFIVQQMFVRDVLERGADLRVFAQDLLRLI